MPAWLDKLKTNLGLADEEEAQEQTLLQQLDQATTLGKKAGCRMLLPPETWLPCQSSFTALLKYKTSCAAPAGTCHWFCNLRQHRPHVDFHGGC